MPHVYRVRVRYAETDAQAVAHHGAYVVWLEAARIEYLRALGQSYRDLEADGIVMPVIDLSIRYRRPLRFDDEVELTTRVTAPSKSRLRFETNLALIDANTTTPVASATVVIATCQADGRPTRVPTVIADAIAAQDDAIAAQNDAAEAVSSSSTTRS